MKRIISLLLILTTLFTTLAVNVSAARTEEFISEVALIYKDSVEEACKAIAGTGWKLFEQDLNANADYIIDDGVYLIYKTSTNVEDAITDLRVMDMYGGYSISNYERELEKSRQEYLTMCKNIRIAADEFKALYNAGDAMAALAYRQMNYYKDVRTAGGTETDMKMGDFFLNMPTDDKIVQVLFEGNTCIIANLISFLAIGISGEDSETLSTKIAQYYAIKDTLTDEDYHEDAVALSKEFANIRAKILRYDALAEKYNLQDEEMSEEEFSFFSNYAALAILVKEIKFGETNLADFIRHGRYTTEDLYPIVAAFTEGQMALIKMGQLETVLKYNAPSKPIKELNEILDEIEADFKDENGVFTPNDVYLGVDRSVFKGSFAMTTAAERQQALTGETWGLDDAASRSKGVQIAYIAASVVDVAVAGFAAGLHIKYKIMYNSARALGSNWKAVAAYQNTWGPVAYVGYWGALGLAIVILGSYGISTWYNYYNPDYTEIPNTMVDVRKTDLGDKYIKYTAAKVFEDGKLSEKNADFNAYQGKEWVALYYTKDAHAGNCLTPNFVFKDNDNSIARRHQGVSMFGEDKAFNLNSHVYDSNAKGAYLTVRYSTTKKAAAELPTVVGSMLVQGAFYALTALAGAGLGVGGTVLFQNKKKKKEKEKTKKENTEANA